MKEDQSISKQNTDKKVLDRSISDLQGKVPDIRRADHFPGEEANLYHDLFENIASGVAVYDAQDNGTTFTIRDFNLAAEQITGVRKDQVIGKDVQSVFPEMATSGLINAFQTVWQTGEPIIKPVSYYQSDRLYRWVEHKISKLPSGQIVAIFEDITERKQAEEALQKSENELDSIVQTTPDIIFRINTEGKITFISDAIKKYGYRPENLIGRDVWEIIEPEERKRAQARMMDRLAGNRRSDKLEVRIINKDNSRQFLGAANADPDNSPIVAIEAERVFGSGDDKDKIQGLQGFARDVTEYNQTRAAKERLEAQLLQAQKMEAIGTLAGGIAHDFNNILGAILGYAQLAEMDIPENNKAKGHMKQILSASERAKGLVGQILAFSRQSSPKRIPVDIGVIVKEASKLLRASLPANIDINLSIEPNLCLVMADQTQIYQVLMNLCTNALHAMEKEGGVLDLTLAPIEINAEEAAAYHDLKAGNYLKLTVSDTGHGMDAVTAARIFDPYFTTKDANEGTGLGLAMVHGIVKDHGGMIKVYSEKGSGAAFEIFLACLDEKSTTADSQSKPLSTGTEQVLFLDDDKVLVDIGEQMLQKLGYKVESRTSPYEALEVFRANPEKFDMVITDMTMPQMSGDTFAQEILKIRSDVPIILCTGFSNLMSPEKAKEFGIEGFLMKPLTMSDLSKNIRKVLDQN